MSHYHDSDDLEILGEFNKLAPAEFSGFVGLGKIVGRDDGKIPRKYRELIALASPRICEGTRRYWRSASISETSA